MIRRQSVLWATLLLLASVCGGWIWARDNSLRDRLLAADPDDLPRDRELMAYALPIRERG